MCYFQLQGNLTGCEEIAGGNDVEVRLSSSLVDAPEILAWDHQVLFFSSSRFGHPEDQVFSHELELLFRLVCFHCHDENRHLDAHGEFGQIVPEILSRDT